MQILLSLQRFKTEKMESFSLAHTIPVKSAVIQSYLGNLKFPKNKISDMGKNGEIIRLKKDLYVRGRAKISKELISNHLYGVSYISLETALAYYGMIPERVYTVRSITIRRAKTFSTPLGYFEYKTVSADYFSIGIHQEIVDNQYAFLIATPTKAICDMIVVTPNLRLQSVKAMENYLIEDLRMDFDVLRTLNTDIVKRCMEVGKKKTALRFLLRFLTEHTSN